MPRTALSDEDKLLQVKYGRCGQPLLVWVAENTEGAHGGLCRLRCRWHLPYPGVFVAPSSAKGSRRFASRDEVTGADEKNRDLRAF